MQEAIRLVETGRLADADAICRGILDQVTDHPPANFLRGLIAFQLGEPERALQLLKVAAAHDPENANYQATLGAVLVERGSPAEAIAVLEKAVSIDPNDGASLRHLARLYGNTGRKADAIAAYERLTGSEQRDLNDFLALGTLLQTERGPGAAIGTFENAAALAPESVLARNHLAACQQLRGRIVESIAAYRDSLALQADNNPATVGLFAAMQTVCDWRGFEELAAQTDRMTGAAIDSGASPVEDPFLNVSRVSDSKQNFAVARSWSADLSRQVAAWGVRFDHTARVRDVLRIGYLSSDFQDHATAHLMLGLFGAHDRTKVSVHAYSCGDDDGSAYRARVAEDCDAFVDLAGVDTIAAARRIHDDGIDILVDLKGYTRRHRLDIAALRPAPVQVAWLGFPGTSGADFFDYIVTDDIVTPPEDAVVLASFNNTYKLEPVMFAAWMELLLELPKAVLWLLPNNPLAVENLRREALDAGVEPDRLIFADMLPKAEHLKRAGVADLALDTRIYNGHTTTSDMLWAGVPVVTLRGRHFASRVSASLLTAFGLGELIAETIDDYKMLAGELARSPDRLLDLRKRVARLRVESSLFDTGCFARDLELAFAEMWRRYENGETPKRLAVSELD